MTLLILCWAPFFLSKRPPHLHDPSHELLHHWVELLLAFSECGEKLVNVIIVVAAFKDIYNG